MTDITFSRPSGRLFRLRTPNVPGAVYRVWSGVRFIGGAALRHEEAAAVSAAAFLFCQQTNFFVIASEAKQSSLG
jgi:hypothetical protein